MKKNKVINFILFTLLPLSSYAFIFLSLPSHAQEQVPFYVKTQRSIFEISPSLIKDSYCQGSDLEKHFSVEKNCLENSQYNPYELKMGTQSFDLVLYFLNHHELDFEGGVSQAKNLRRDALKCGLTRFVSFIDQYIENIPSDSEKKLLQAYQQLKIHSAINPSLYYAELLVFALKFKLQDLIASLLRNGHVLDLKQKIKLGDYPELQSGSEVTLLNYLLSHGDDEFWRENASLFAGLAEKAEIQPHLVFQLMKKGRGNLAKIFASEQMPGHAHLKKEIVEMTAVQPTSYDKKFHLMTMVKEDFVPSELKSQVGEYLSSLQRLSKLVSPLGNLTEVQEIAQFTHTKSVNGLNFSPNEKYVASASDDYNVKIADIEKNEVIETLRHQSYTTDVAFTDDDKSLVSGGHDKNLQLSFLNENGDGENAKKRIETFKLPYQIKNLHYDFRRKAYVSISIGREARISSHSLIGQDLKENWVVKMQSPSRLTKTGLSSSGNTLAAIDELSSSIKVLDLANGKVLKEYPVIAEKVLSVTFSPDDQRLLVGRTDGAINIISMVDNPDNQQQHNVHENQISQAQFTPDGKFLVTGSYDKKVKIFNVEDGSLAYELTENSGISDVKFSPSGRYMAVGMSSGQVKVYKLSWTNI